MDALPQPVSPSVRTATVEDLPWILSLAHRRYTRTPDPGTTLAWLVQVLRAPNALALRSEGAFCVTVVHVPPWWPQDREAHVEVLVAEKGCHWQAVRLLRESIAWARRKDCVNWRLSSETDYDFAALAKRVGAKPRVVWHEISLRA